MKQTVDYFKSIVITIITELHSDDIHTEKAGRPYNDAHRNSLRVQMKLHTKLSRASCAPK